MPLASGTRLGFYEIVRPIGAGGMGEVYEGLDTRLSRRVAVKVLAGAITTRPESRERFQREARTISQLQHAHICTLYDIGTHDGHDYLVLEYLEGETLASRLERGPLSVNDALGIARQIALALDAAHRRGIVHRDLKPANVMLTKSSGRSGAPPSDAAASVKLLDFGLAKEATSTTEIAVAATRTVLPGERGAPLTAEGTLVGTFQYMAPEQIEGGNLDARTDLWALGCVIYEMVTGARPFQGKTPASLMSAVLRDEPAPPSSRQPLAPITLDALVRTCLAKDPDDRFSTAHDVVIALSWVRDHSGTTATPPQVARAASRRWVALAAAAAAIAVAGAAAFVAGTRAVPQASTVWLDVPLPDGTTGIGTPAVSPDGSAVVFATGGRLWLKRFANPELQALPDTDDAFLPFWSPDSREIAFGAKGRLRRLAIDASAAIDICPAKANRGGLWLPDGTILVSLDIEAPLSRVPAGGGTPVAVTALDASHGEISHRYPAALPGGRFLFQGYTRDAAEIGIWIAPIDHPERRELLLKVRSHVEYAMGHLLFVRSGALVAQPFDATAGRVSGRQIVIARRVTEGDLFHWFNFSASANGTVAIGSVHSLRRQVEIVDRGGKLLRPIKPEGELYSLEVSPTGDRVALGRRDHVTVVDLKALNEYALTDPQGPVSGDPIWSPGGERIFFSASAGPVGAPNIFSKAPGSDLPPTPAVTPAAANQVAAGWSADGSLYWLAPNIAAGGQGDLYRQAAGTTTTELFVLTPNADDGPGRISHDGRWLAYAGAPAGKPTQIIVRNLINKDLWRQVAVSGGHEPRWRKDGRELYFVSDDKSLMAAGIRTEPTLEIDPPAKLFPVEVHEGCSGYCYDVLPDGTFIVARAVTRRTVTIGAVLNWKPPAQ